MHPIERLRFVARAQGVDDRLLAVEATAALMTFADHPAALVAACRRVLARQVCCGPLWWACARLVTAEDLWATAQHTISLLEHDPTEAALSYALGEHAESHSDGGSPVEVLHARAHNTTTVLLCETPDESPEERSEAAGGVQRWLVAGVGTALCEPMWSSLVRAADSRAELGSRPVFGNLSRFTHVVGPGGAVPTSLLAEPDCPVAPELFTLEG